VIDTKQLACITRYGDDTHKELVTTIVHLQEHIDILKQDVYYLERLAESLQQENTFLTGLIEHKEAE